MLRLLACLFIVTTSAPAWAEGPVAAGAAPDGGTALDADAVDEVAPEVAAPTAAPRPPEPPPFSDEELARPVGAVDIMGSFIKTMLMLGVVLGLVWLTLSKGMGKLVERAQAGKRVKVLERIALDARRSLFLVEVDGKQFVLGGGDVVRLHELSPDARPFNAVLTTASAQPPLTTSAGPAPSSSSSSSSSSSATSRTAETA